MLNRPIILKLLLGALAFAAVCGALAVLAGSGEVIGRVAWTAVSVAVACAMGLGASKLHDRRTTRTAGLLAMVVTVLEFLMALALIWADSILDDEIRLFVTMLLLLPAAGAAMGGLAMREREAMWIGGTTALAVAAGAFVTAALALWWDELFSAMPSRYRIEEDLWMTALGLAVNGGLAALVLAGWTPGRTRPWQPAGAGVAALAFTLWCVGTWTEPDAGATVFVAVLSLAVVAAHANGLHLCRLAPSLGWLRAATIGATALAAVLLTVAVGLEESDLDGETVVRVAAAVGVLAGCGTLAILILALFTRATATDDHVTDLRLECPRCGKKQTLPLGETACGSCGLGFELAVFEEHCPVCDYALKGLASERCPECGAAVHVRG